MGQGTTFRFDLRLKIPPAAAEPAVPANAEGEPLKGLRVLVADDNEVNLFVLTGFLRSWGVEPDVVATGRQAVERIQEKDYDLVLMDLSMPELDGYAATRQIRCLPDPRFRQLPIFAVSASIRMDPQHEIEEAGFTDFVGKPVSPDILFAKIVRHISRMH